MEIEKVDKLLELLEELENLEWDNEENIDKDNIYDLNIPLCACLDLLEIYLVKEYKCKNLKAWKI